MFLLTDLRDWGPLGDALGPLVRGPGGCPTEGAHSDLVLLEGLVPSAPSSKSKVPELGSSLFLWATETFNSGGPSSSQVVTQAGGAR